MTKEAHVLHRLKPSAYRNMNKLVRIIQPIEEVFRNFQKYEHPLIIRTHHITVRVLKQCTLYMHKLVQKVCHCFHKNLPTCQKIKNASFTENGATWQIQKTATCDQN